jgi:type III pantothenate kinase
MTKSLIAVDVGNSFLHLGRYSLDDRDEFGFPQLLPWTGSGVAAALRLETPDEQLFRELDTPVTGWFVASVNRERQSKLAAAVRSLRPAEPYHVLTHHDFPLTVDVKVPARVGIDRLAAGLAAFHLRQRASSVIIVDVGTAITVDRVDEPGVFRGGAILPGPFLLADSLHRHTDALPLVPIPTAPPCPVGKNTEEAIASGIFWGVAGAIRELVSQMRADTAGAAEVFFTGGAEQTKIAELIEARYESDLVLRSVAWVGARMLS